MSYIIVYLVVKISKLRTKNHSKRTIYVNVYPIITAEAQFQCRKNDYNVLASNDCNFLAPMPANTYKSLGIGVPKGIIKTVHGAY